MSTRLTISLDSTERAALIKLAQQEMRDPRDQIRYLLRQELERRGYLCDETRGEVQYKVLEAQYEAVPA